MVVHDRVIHVLRLGRTDYTACWNLQRQLASLREAGRAPDLLLLTEHAHVYTLGRTGDENHLLAGEEELAACGAAFVRTDRGGDITYHGPGQLVGYPILDLHSFVPDLHRYLRDLEEAVIRVLRRWDVSGTRAPGYTGVWVGQEKICAIGVRTRRWITMHGFALNVNTDLAYFARIIPCGIFHKGVTSLCEQVGGAVDLATVADELIARFGDVFGAAMQDAPELLTSLVADCQGA